MTWYRPVVRTELLLAVAIGLGCESDPSPPPATARPGARGVTPGLAEIDERTSSPGTSAPVSIGTGGGFVVEGTPPLRGDPAACASFRACCDPHRGQITPAGLACGLAPAVGNGDCARALRSVRGIFHEQGVTPPPGCAPPTP